MTTTTTTQRTTSNAALDMCLLCAGTGVFSSPLYHDGDPVPCHECNATGQYVPADERTNWQSLHAYDVAAFAPAASAPQADEPSAPAPTPRPAMTIPFARRLNCEAFNLHLRVIAAAYNRETKYGRYYSGPYTTEDARYIERCKYVSVACEARVARREYKYQQLIAAELADQGIDVLVAAERSSTAS